MPKKHRPKACLFTNCKNGAMLGLKICREHQHPLKLQEEIERLKLAKADGLAGLLKYEPVRLLLESLADLHFTAVPQKSSSIGLVGRNGFGDGLVEFGGTVVLGSAAAGVKGAQGRLGEALGRVKSCWEDVEGIRDPLRPPRKDLRVTCGDVDCPKRWAKQPVDSRFCRFCGRGLRELEAVG